MPGGNPGIPEAESGNFIWSRRDILSLAGWGAILTCFAAAGGAILRLLFPRVLFEPPTSFKAGYPTEYTVGDVSEKWMKSQRVWIVRTQDRLDRKSTRLNSSHSQISYAVFCLKKKKRERNGVVQPWCLGRRRRSA